MTHSERFCNILPKLNARNTEPLVAEKCVLFTKVCNGFYKGVIDCQVKKNVTNVMETKKCRHNSNFFVPIEVYKYRQNLSPGGGLFPYMGYIGMQI